jgi:hypothetical protein
MWSKLHSVKDEISSIRIVDGHPRRTKDYVHCCGIMDADYDLDRKGPNGEILEHAIVGRDYMRILQFEGAMGLDFASKPTWKKVRQVAGRPDAIIPLEANRHLEEGWPLKDWLPDLPTNYHYPLYVKNEDRASSRKYTQGAINGDRFGPPHPMKEGPIVGISCASYRGAEAWQTWGKEEWCDFLRRVMDLGWRPLLVGGGWDDLTTVIACELDLPFTVGRTSVPQMVEQMNHLDSYIGYSSGMNVIRTVLNKPAFALWPDNDRCDQSRLMWSWAPPQMIESGRYQAQTWRPVADVWPVAKYFLRRCEKEVGK